MLDIQHLSKTYKRGNKEALVDVSLYVVQGEFTALLGQNGAGKSTLINILAGNVKKSSGNVSIGGYDLDTQELETKRVIGIVPQEMGFDYIFTVDEVLKKQSGYFGNRNNGKYIDELLDLLSLRDKRSSKVKDLSGGMKRRLMIAKALIHRPKILVLDEPTAGVDIDMRHTMYQLLRELNRNGTTIILTTHYLEEAEKLCDRIAIINDGRLIADEPKDHLIEQFGTSSVVEVQFDHEPDKTYLETLKEYQPRVEQDTKLYLTVDRENITKMLETLVQLKIGFGNLAIERPKLEDIYLNLIRH